MILDTFIPDSLKQPVVTYTSTKNLVGAFFIAIIVMICFAIIYYFLKQPAATIALLFIASLNILLLLQLKYIGSIKLSREGILGLTFLVLIWLSYSQGGLFSPTLFWIAIVPLTAIYLGSRLSGFFWEIACIIAILVFYLIYINSLPMPVFPIKNAPLFECIAIIGLMITFFLLALLFELAKLQSFSQLEAANKIIEKKSDELAISLAEQNHIREREKQLHKKLVITARQAGMADVATSVLHNIGNVLNSVNVSATLLNEMLQKSKLHTGFIAVNQKLKEHQQDLAKYITEDPQGKHLPEYLALLELSLKEEQANATKELNSLTNNIQHIKDIVVMQQSFGAVLGMVEPVNVPEQIEAAVAMTGFNNAFDIERDYQMKEPIVLDKVKLIQILVNLIRNAKDALMESTNEKKELFLTVKQKSEDIIQIQVIDNGVGVNPENINKIFTFGFTTKKKAMVMDSTPVHY